MGENNGYIAVDLDGTLAEYNGWVDEFHIGKPVPEMVSKVRKAINEGTEVRIFTARISGDRQGVPVEKTIKIIEDWCEKHIGFKLPVSCTKDFHMIELWDDRAVTVIKNTGKFWYE